MTVTKVNSNTYENGTTSGIGGNSVVFEKGDFLTKTGGFMVLATAGSVIEGVCQEDVTMESDNQTVAMVRVPFEAQKEQTQYAVTITGGTITQVDEGKYYDLSDEVTVDGTSEHATSGQLRMVKFVSATESLFVIANT